MPWNREVPTLFVANHTSWWDGFFSCLLTRELGLTFHVLMEAVHLDRYRFFRSIGALPLRRDSAGGAYADLGAAERALVPGSTLWVYPQGQRRPAAEPLGRLERGAAHLAVGHEGPLRICPVAFRYVFMSEQLPEAFALIGESWLHDGSHDRTVLTACIGEAMTQTLAALDEIIRCLDTPRSPQSRSPLTSHGLRFLVPPRLSINKRLDLFRHRLGLLDGDFDPRNG